MMDIMSTQSRSDRRLRALEKNDLHMGASAPLRVVGGVCSIVQRPASGRFCRPAAGARHQNHGHRKTRTVSTRLELGLHQLARSARIGYSNGSVKTATRMNR